MTTYRSKIGIEIMIPMLLIIVWIMISMINAKNWGGLAIIMLTSAFFAHILFTTYYLVIRETVIVKCSFLINTSIHIGSIKTIRESGSILAAAAASLDRLEIIYNENDSILISPKDKEAFIEHMLLINPNIVVVRKKL
ncbi:MAG TPA: PH domain-containing protein [Chitinophagaceae bacterium]|nr:PH domain-containing protein [Chitinophagaceae bacterium]